MKKKVVKKDRKIKNHDVSKRISTLQKEIIVLFVLVLGLITFIGIQILFVNPSKKEIKIINKAIDDNYVFLGDSITEGYDLEEFFPDKPVINSGVSGYRAKDLLSRLDNMVYRYNPSKVFLLIGTNDIAIGKDKDYIIERIGKIIDEIKLNRKYTEIYVESIYPINSNKIKNRSNDFINELNNEIQLLCKEKEVKYINVHKLLLDENGELSENYSDDGLHLTYEGYEVVTEKLEKYLK